MEDLAVGQRDSLTAWEQDLPLVLEQASSKAVGRYLALGRVTYLCFRGRDPGST